MLVHGRTLRTDLLTIMDDLRLVRVVLGPSGTILCGLATRLLQLFAHHDHHIFFVSCVCV